MHGNERNELDINIQSSFISHFLSFLNDEIFLSWYVFSIQFAEQNMQEEKPRKSGFSSFIHFYSVFAWHTHNSVLKNIEHCIEWTDFWNVRLASKIWSYRAFSGWNSTKISTETQDFGKLFNLSKNLTHKKIFCAFLLWFQNFVMQMFAEHIENENENMRRAKCIQIMSNQ